MSTFRQLRAIVTHALALAAMGFACSVHAQLPAQCSGQDVAAYGTYQEELLIALLNDYSQQVVSLTENLMQRLSPTCHTALQRQYPASSQCTRAERSLVLEHFSQIYSAAATGNLPAVFSIYYQLEGSVSHGCWVAANRHTDAEVVNRCSDKELDSMAASTGPLLRGTERLLTQMDMSVIALTQQVLSGLSPGCLASLQDYQARQQGGSSPASSGGARGVINHGDGRLTVPNVGSCTQSECIAF